MFLKTFFANPDVFENVKPQLALIILAGPPIIPMMNNNTNYAIEILPDNTGKTFNDLSK